MQYQPKHPRHDRFRFDSIVHLFFTAEYFLARHSIISWAKNKFFLSLLFRHISTIEIHQSFSIIFGSDTKLKKL